LAITGRRLTAAVTSADTVARLPTAVAVLPGHRAAARCRPFAETLRQAVAGRSPEQGVFLTASIGIAG
jgi:GGDEF domain-containing protein